MFKLLHAGTQRKKIQIIHEKEVSEEKLREAFLSQFGDISMCVCYVIMLIWITEMNHPAHGIQFTQIMKEFIINAVFADMRPLEEVESRQTMIEYISSTVLQNLFATRSEESLTYLNSKVIGVPRMRQIRVKYHMCKVSDVWKGVFGKDCFDIIDHKSIEKDHYTPYWENTIKDCNFYNESQIPWCFQTSDMSGGHRIHGKHFSYPGVGYVTYLGMSEQTSLEKLNSLLNSNWFDAQTRVLIIEFSTYNANANIFNTVSVIIHRTGTGRYLTDFKIRTYRFLFIEPDLWTIAYRTFILFFCVSMAFLVKLFIDRSLLSLRAFVSSPWNCIDLFIMICAFMTCIMYLARNQYVVNLIREIKEDNHDVQSKFSVCIRIQHFIDLMIALVIVLTSVRFGKLFRFFEIVRTVQRTVVTSLVPIISLFFVMSMLVIGFASYFHIVLGSSWFDCRTMHSTFITLLILPMGMANYFIHDLLLSRSTGGFVFFCLFYIAHIILILHLFMTLIICNYHSTIRTDRPKINLRTLKHLCIYLLKRISSMFISRLKEEEKPVIPPKQIISTMQLRAMKYLTFGLYKNSSATEFTDKNVDSLKYKHKCMKMLTADKLNMYDNDKRFHFLITDKYGKYFRKKQMRTMLHTVRRMVPPNFLYKFDKSDKRVHRIELSAEMKKINKKIEYCNTRASEISDELAELIKDVQNSDNKSTVDANKPLGKKKKSKK